MRFTRVAVDQVVEFSDEGSVLHLDAAEFDAPDPAAARLRIDDGLADQAALGVQDVGRATLPAALTLVEPLRGRLTDRGGVASALHLECGTDPARVSTSPFALDDGARTRSTTASQSLRALRYAVPPGSSTRP